MAAADAELCSDASESDGAADAADNEMDQASSKAEETDDLAHRGRGGRAQAKAAKVAACKKRGKANKVKSGNKFCMPCNREHLVSEFPPGKNMCGPSWNAVRNITAAAERQGHLEWWVATQAQPSKLRRVVQTYMKNIAPEVLGPSGKKLKKGVFCCATYLEEVRHAEQLLIDGVYEMLNCAAYIHWAGKAKNGNVDADEAKLRWGQEYDKPGAITDELGPTTKLKRRVAIRVKDLVIVRDMSERSQLAQFQGEQVRKADQDVVNRMESRLRQNASFSSTSAVGRLDAAQQLVQNRGAGADGIFSEAARSAAVIGDLKNTFGEHMQEDEAETALESEADAEDESTTQTADNKITNGNPAAGGSSTTGSGGTPSGGKGGKPKQEAEPAWFSRQEKVGELLMGHMQWSTATRGSLKSTQQELEAAILGVPKTVEHMVDMEKALVQTRLKAIKLVLADSHLDVAAAGDTAAAATVAAGSVKQTSNTEAPSGDTVGAAAELALASGRGSEEPAMVDVRPPAGPAAAEPPNAASVASLSAEERAKAALEAAEAEEQRAKEADRVETEVAKDSKTEDEASRQIEAAAEAGAAVAAVDASTEDSKEAPKEDSKEDSGKASGKGASAASNGEAADSADVPKTPNKKFAAESPAPPPSTVNKFIARHGSAEKALRSYIASFATFAMEDDAATGGCELGKQPPCRSYRNLRILDELQATIESEIRSISRKEQCAEVGRANKPFKTALKDCVANVLFYCCLFSTS